MTSIPIASDFIVQTCCRSDCGMLFAVPKDWDRAKRNDHTSFYCPNGHGQKYTGESEEEKLKRELAQALANTQWTENRLTAEREIREATERRLAATKGVVTRTRRRIGKGVCACCNRSFPNLAAHMQTQHPDYAHASE